MYGGYDYMIYSLYFRLMTLSHKYHIFSTY